MTALMYAAIGGHVNVLKTLIENKADVNMLTKVHVLHNNNTLTHPLISREIWCCMYSIVLKNLRIIMVE